MPDKNLNYLTGCIICLSLMPTSLKCLKVPRCARKHLKYEPRENYETPPRVDRTLSYSRTGLLYTAIMTQRSVKNQVLAVFKLTTSSRNT